MSVKEIQNVDAQFKESEAVLLVMLDELQITDETFPPFYNLFSGASK